MFDTNFFILLLALFLGSIGSILLASVVFFLPKRKLEGLTNILMYFAGGSLLGAAFLGLIPELLEHNKSEHIFAYIPIGILIFFIIEKIVLWRICVNQNCERHVHAAAPMITIGDAFHNAIDGIAIAASFSISVNFGILTTLSVMMHEIPQELGDFGVLLRSGLSRKKALLYNVISGSSAIVFGVAAYFLMNKIQLIIPFLLSLSASSFIYISLADLIPEMHRKTRLKDSITQIIFVFLGMLMIMLLKHNH